MKKVSVFGQSVAKSKMSIKAFTLLEIIVVIFVMLIILSAGSLVPRGLVNRQYLTDSVNRLMTDLQLQYRRSTTGYLQDSWSASFDQAGLRYTLFKGNNFATRDQSYDQTVNLERFVSFQEVALSGSGAILTFTRPKGKTPGNSRIVLQNEQGFSSTIYINGFGVVSLKPFPETGPSQPPPPPPPPPPQNYTVDLASQIDSDMYKGSATSNYGSSTTIWVQSWWFSYHRRGIIQFDVSSIPTDSVITSASLKLYVVNTQGTARNYGAHRVQQNPVRDWSETHVTWNRYKSGNNWTAAGGDFISPATDTESAGSWPGSPYQVSFDVTSDVQNFVSDPTQNFGWVIRDQAEGGTAQYYVQFASKEHGTAVYRPALHLEYQR